MCVYNVNCEGKIKSKTNLKNVNHKNTNYTIIEKKFFHFPNLQIFIRKYSKLEIYKLYNYFLTRNHIAKKEIFKIFTKLLFKHTKNSAKIEIKIYAFSKLKTPQQYFKYIQLENFLFQLKSIPRDIFKDKIVCKMIIQSKIKL